MAGKYDPLVWNDELESTIYSKEQIEQIHLEGEFLRSLVQARNDMNITQKKLGELSGIKQSAIARLERGSASPNVRTIIKLLQPLGKTLAIVPCNEPRRALRAASPAYAQ